MSFLSFLEQKKLISQDTIKEIADKRDKGLAVSLEDELIKGGLKEDVLLEARGEYYHIPIKEVGEERIAAEILQHIPEKSAQHYRIIPLAFKSGVLEVGIVDPDDVEARDAVQFSVAKENIPYKIFLIKPSDYERAFEGYTGLTGTVNEALGVLDQAIADEKEPKKKGKEIKIGQGTAEEESIEAMGDADVVEEAPVTKIVATIIRYATEGNASDVHIEHMDKEVRVRFRVDGELFTSLKLPSNVHSAVVARIKILSKLRLDEKRKPQDGRFSAHIDGRKIDFRVSTFPAYYGEKVVMRILDSERGVVPLAELGLSERDEGLVRKAIQAPYGMILISGPTGSGKTTTLYSMLNELDRETQNVLSLEDPVEYNVPGISQSQVRPEIGYTFASGLRTTLRQDPDIIMVGEIRDKETAQLAIQASLTGHLVLSTIHTNTAIGVIPRLIDMGIDPYLIAPTLIMTMGQRLTKRLCPGAGKPIPVEDSIRVMVEKELENIPDRYRRTIEIPREVYEAAPGKDCPSGTKGRLAVFEVLDINKRIEKAILDNPTENNIMEIAREDGMITMREDALIKAFRREIPFEEVNKL
ncbi:MAG: GspE/PulE family protein [Candidatus Paceibacterota bacterium]